MASVIIKEWRCLSKLYPRTGTINFIHSYCVVYLLFLRFPNIVGRLMSLFVWIFSNELMVTIPLAASTSCCLRPPDADACNSGLTTLKTAPFIFSQKMRLFTYSSSVGFRGGVRRLARTRQEFGSVTPPLKSGTQPSELWARPPWLPGQSRGEHPRTVVPVTEVDVQVQRGDLWVKFSSCWSTCPHPISAT